MDQKDKVYVAGHSGMVGSALTRTLRAKGFTNIITASFKELDLRDSKKVEFFFKDTKPDYVFLAAAKVGGIEANRRYPADFLLENLQIQNNVIHESFKSKVKKLVFLGSSCIYPRECPQPMKEEYLLTGPLEPTNEGYALAKVAGLKLAQFYQKQYGLACINPIPCNLYGTNDSYDPINSHVISAQVKKFVDAADDNKKHVVLWGSGNARREFMHVNDMAEALLFLVNAWDSPEIINVGSGTDISIKELAYLIADKSGFRGEIKWDTSMPDGMFRKCLDISKLTSLKYRPSVTLQQGIEQTIEEYRKLKKAGSFT